MKNIIKICVASLVFFVATRSFAQSTGNAENQIGAIGASNLASSVLLMGTAINTGFNDRSMSRFEQTHPRFRNFADKHPKFAGRMFDNRDRLTDKKITGKEIWHHRGDIESRVQNRIHQRKAG